ncbi:MAG: L-aspartate oxidase, partial [candidate division Zixibacteria bacterium]|nr:L-aspartate oxidase [candidate division Zixibacteria bacterium]
AHDRRELNRIMSDFVGIVRTTKHLKLAHQRIKQLDQAVEDYYLATPATYGVVELRNMTTVAELIVGSALSREESRGLHYNEDYPGMIEGEARDTIIEGKSTDERQRPKE